MSMKKSGLTNKNVKKFKLKIVIEIQISASPHLCVSFQ